MIWNRFFTRYMVSEKGGEGVVTKSTIDCDKHHNIILTHFYPINFEKHTAWIKFKLDLFMLNLVCPEMENMLLFILTGRWRE